MYYGTEEVEVLNRRPCLSQIEFKDGRITTVKNEELSDFVRTKKIYKPLDVKPAELSEVFLQSLVEVRNQVHIRVHYPKHAEAHIQETFSKAGVSLPEDIRALDSGARGGFTTQRDWAAVVWFPAIAGVQMPNGTKKDLSNVDRLINSRRDIVLAILKAGFPITDYTHEKI